MKAKIFSARFIFIISIIVIAALLRIFIDIPNVTPIAALAIFGGAYLGRKHLAFLIPLAALFVTDIFLGFYHIEVMLPVYLCFVISVFIGIQLRKRMNAMNVVMASLISSIVFFVVTNFFVWLSGSIVEYTMSFSGLMLCYAKAIPFYRFEVLGTLAYTLIFFVSFYFAQQRFPVLAKQKVQA